MTKKTSRGFERLLILALVVASLESKAMGQAGSPRPLRQDSELAQGPSVAIGRSIRAVQPFVQTGRMQPNETHLIVESAPVSFGEVVANRESELEDALMVRVFSDSDWELRLVPEASGGVADRMTTSSMSGLEWRSLSSRWSGLRVGEPVVVSRGRRTGPSGELVSVDLRLQLSDRDPLGQYGFNLRLALEAVQ